MNLLDQFNERYVDAENRMKQTWANNQC